MTPTLARSALYLPASNPRAVEKARTLGADVVILDLEDAVAPDAKEAARAAAVEAANAGGFGRSLVAIRVNPLETAWGAADFAAVDHSKAAVVVVPKVDSAAQAVQTVAAAGGKPVWAMIESPRSILALPEIAGTRGVEALIAGNADLAKELRATVDADRSALLYALSAMVVAARAFGLLALDGIHADIADLDGVDRTSRQGAALGFDGRTVIHPTHIDSANRAYSPSDEAIEDARGLVAAHEAARAEGRGAATYRGRMIEHLHAEVARRTLALADAIAGR